QMRAGRAAGHADIADQVAFAHGSADGKSAREFGEMGIERGELRRVLDLDGQPVLEIPALVIDDAIGRSIDRLADARCEIDAVVEAAAGEAAVVASWAEGRRDARTWFGLRQGRAAQPAPGFVEPTLRFVLRCEPPEGLLALAFANRNVERTYRAL